ncbi:MAG: aldose epimerase family protein [Clostridiaceae bacterium]|nr:aldose epimerase family protein [Clostridiaceae bacterium]
MSITKAVFGAFESGELVYAYTLTNRMGVSATILNLGGIIQKLMIPDRAGKLADVILGYDTVEGYLTGGGCHGALIGRFANRIRDGRFTLDSVTYTLPRNELGVTSLHGNQEFNCAIWDAEPDDANNSLRLTHVSPDGSNGFPGELTILVTYTFDDDCALTIRYEAVSTKTTVVNFTNHAYFNLAGGGSIFGQVLTLDCSRFTENDPALCIPTGRIVDVADTPGFDFRTGRVIGENVALADPGALFSGGYDHNFILDRDASGLTHAAAVYDPQSGRRLDAYTTLPAVQVYTANNMKGNYPLKSGVPQTPHTGICLETQGYPDAPNQPAFPSARLEAGEKFVSVTRYRFSVQ